MDFLFSFCASWQMTIDDIAEVYLWPRRAWITDVSTWLLGWLGFKRTSDTFEAFVAFLVERSLGLKL